MKKLVLLVIYFLTVLSHVIAQQKIDDLPIVSDEVYHAITQFYEYDKVPLNPIKVQKKKIEFGKREKVVFTGAHNIRVPSYLVIPNKKAEKYPVVLLADGIYGTKERWFIDNSWPKGKEVINALLKEGIAVMVLDAVYHGERAADYNYERPPWLISQPHDGNRMVMQTAVEYRRALDYLETRSEIDTSRIGMMGLSMGGIITYQVTAVDSRVQTAIIGVAPTLKDYPKLQPIVPTTFASRVKVRSLLNFMGNKDGLYTIPEAKQLFNRVPTEDKTFVEFNTGHEPPIEYVDLVKKWFVKYLIL